MLNIVKMRAELNLHVPQLLGRDLHVVACVTLVRHKTGFVPCTLLQSFLWTDIPGKIYKHVRSLVQATASASYEILDSALRATCKQG